MRDWPQRGNSTNSRRSWCKEQLRCRLDWPGQISAWQRSHAGGICLKSAFWNAPEICPLWCRGTQFTGRSLTRDSLLQNCLRSSGQAAGHHEQPYPQVPAVGRGPGGRLSPCGVSPAPSTETLRTLPVHPSEGSDLFSWSLQKGWTQGWGGHVVIASTVT